MPAALSYPMNMPKYDWGYRTDAETHLGNRRLACPRGKVIGGSSSINGMVFVRGHRKDYDSWAAGGVKEWAFAMCCLIYAHGNRAWRANRLARQRRAFACYSWRCANPLYNAFIAAGVEAGFGKTADYNGEKQEGFCQLQQTVWRGKRWSAASAYLRPH